MENYGINLDYAIQSYTNRYSSLLGDINLTNEIVIDDIMQALGYNKKIDADVHRTYNFSVDWYISNEDKNTYTLVVKTFDVETSLEENIDMLKEQMIEAFKMACEKCFNVIMFTNGKELILYRFVDITDNIEDNYKKVGYINLHNIIDEDDYKILNAISKENYSLDIIDSIIEKRTLTIEKVRKYLKESIVEINSIITEKYKIDTDYSELLSSLITESLEVQTVEVEVVKEVEVEKQDNKISIEELTIDKLPVELVEQIKQNILQKYENDITINNVNISSESLITSSIQSIEDVPEDILKQIRAPYAKQIEDLTEQYYIEQEQREKAETEVRELQEELSRLAGTDREQALRALENIKISNNEPRQYVGYLDYELYREKSLTDFVESTLEKLIDIKGITASQKIFDIEEFNLESTTESTKLLISGKNYKVDISELSEEQTLNLLRIVTSSFSDLVFECKAEGGATENSNEIDVSELSDLEVLDTEEFEANKSSEYYNQEQPENQELADEDTTEEVNELNEMDSLNDSGDEINLDTEYQSDNQKQYKSLIALQLSSYASILDMDSEIEFGDIKYIGENTDVLVINNEDIRTSMCESITALLAIQYKRELSDMINKQEAVDVKLLKEFRETDWLTSVDGITRFTDLEQSKYRIAGSRYVANAENSLQILKSLYTIGNELGINIDSIFVYIEVETDSEDIVQYYSYDESELSIYENSECINSNGISNIQSQIAGDMSVKTILTKKVYETHQKLFINSMAIKTKYLQSYLNSDEEILNVISKMIEQAGVNQDKIDKACDLTFISDNCYFISTNSEQVREENTKLDINGISFYVSKLNRNEIAEMLVKLHIAINADTSIRVQVALDEEVYNWLITEFSTTEPILSLATYTLLTYITFYIFKSK